MNKKNRRLFNVNLKILKESVSAKFKVNYSDVNVEFNPHDEMVFNINLGVISEIVNLTDSRIYDALKIDRANIELDYMIYSDDYTFLADEKDENTNFDIFTKDLSDLKEVA